MKSYVPNTAAQRAEMLRAISMSSMEDLFRDIPEDVRLKAPLKLDRGMSEEEVRRVFRAYAKIPTRPCPFSGARARTGIIYRPSFPSLPRARSFIPHTPLTRPK